MTGARTNISLLLNCTDRRAKFLIKKVAIVELTFYLHLLPAKRHLENTPPSNSVKNHDEYIEDRRVMSSEYYYGEHRSPMTSMSGLKIRVRKSEKAIINLGPFCWLNVVKL
jgi:hypothetical protein